MACDTEISSLPILESCPTGVEYTMLIGVPALINGDNPGGYGLIKTTSFFSCFGLYSAISVPQRIQFVVGDSGSFEGSVNQTLITLPIDGGTQLIINLKCIVDSVEVFLDGSILPREMTDRVSYGVVYNSNNVEVNLFPEFNNDQLYIVKFETLTVISLDIVNKWTYWTASSETYTTDPMPELSGATIEQIFNNILPLKPINFTFDSVALTITLDSATLPPMQADDTLFINYSKPVV